VGCQTLPGLPGVLLVQTTVGQHSGSKNQQRLHDFPSAARGGVGRERLDPSPVARDKGQRGGRDVARLIHCISHAQHGAILE
jgi:hypothetical protein